MDALAPFRIPVASLKAEEARYNWELGPDFFKLFDDEHETEKGQFNVGMILNSTGTVTTLEFQVSGVVQTFCDRCLVPIEIPISGLYEIIVKFGDPKDTTDEVIFVDSEANGLNVGQLIYDFVLLSIPISRRIPGCDTMENPPCDMTILSYLSEKKDENNSIQGDDSPWGDLSKAIDN
ncbi:MAG TPA: DUF177 domain-containing protein [Saprospiraceae bacterium]|nr:DUF177 domain-containing protein [Saprospiraceae bacterium]